MCKRFSFFLIIFILYFALGVSSASYSQVLNDNDSQNDYHFRAALSARQYMNDAIKQQTQIIDKAKKQVQTPKLANNTIKNNKNVSDNLTRDNQKIKLNSKDIVNPQNNIDNNISKSKIKEIISKIGLLPIFTICFLFFFNIINPKIKLTKYKALSFKKYTPEYIKDFYNQKYQQNNPQPESFNLDSNRLSYIEKVYKKHKETLIIEAPNAFVLLAIIFLFMPTISNINNILETDLFFVPIIIIILLSYEPVKYFQNYIKLENLIENKELKDKEFQNYLLYKGCLDLYNQKIEEERKLKEEQERLKREAEEKVLRQKKSYWQKFWADVQKDGFTFEREIANLYRKLGFQVELTKGTGDGGVDLILLKDGVKSIVQCKAHLQSVGPEPVRALWGVKDDFKADEVILIAYSGVTSGARDFARKKNYKILDINDIINLCLKVNKD